MGEQIGLDRLTGLVAFARAGSLGSFTSAARALSISPSAVSKSIQRLEQQLGVTLFTRTTRSLVLTPEGREIHERALKLIEDAQAIEQLASSSRGEPSGLLRVATSLPLALHIIAPSLPAFLEANPEVRIDLRVTDRMSDLIDEGIDVAVRLGELADSQLMSKRLAGIRIGCFASPRYLERRGVPKEPHDLQGHMLVNLRYQSTGQLFRWPFASGERRWEFLPEAAIVSDVSDAVLAILRAGGGIGMAADFAARPHVRSGELVPLLEAYCAEQSPVTAVWSASRRSNPAVKAFVTHLGQVFR